MLKINTTLIEDSIENATYFVQQVMHKSRIFDSYTANQTTYYAMYSFTEV